MARITAVIDIGSNSARMVIFCRTSRFGFHLLKEIKSKVRIPEGAYENGGNLQPFAMERAINALSEFLDIAKSYKATKTLCVATSAVRDAPNKSEFLSLVRKKLSLNIKVIDGEKEAYYGAVSAINMLKAEDAITVDIGGGSTELALIKNGKIDGLVSLNIGTVRLKELFFDKSLPIEAAKEFIGKELSKIPQNFVSDTIIGIGGTNRALANAIMATNNYPVDTLHGFEFCLDEGALFIDKIINTKPHKLKALKIKPERFDVIREGALIIESIIGLTKAKKMVASGVGVREGVFLTDLLRNQNHKFPKNFFLSLKSLTDRFDINEKETKAVSSVAKKLFFALRPLHRLEDSKIFFLENSAKLLNIGISLNFYSHRHHGYYLILNNLDYGYTHIEKLIIASICKYHGKKFTDLDDDEFKEMLLPHENTVKWLSTILSIAEAICTDNTSKSIEISYENEIIYIKSGSRMYLAEERIKGFLKGSGVGYRFESL